MRMHPPKWIQSATARLGGWWGRKLQRQVLIWFLGVMLILLGLQGYLSLQAGYTNVRDQIEADNRRLANLVAKNISNQYDAILQRVILLRTELTSATDPNRQASLLLDFRRSQPLTYRAFYLFNGEGRLLMHLADPLDALIALENPEEIVQRAPIPFGEEVSAAWKGAAGGDTYSSAVQIVGADQMPVITLGLPIPGAGEPLQEVLAVEIGLSDLWRGVDQVFLGWTGRAWITSAEGLIIAHPDRSYIGKPIPIALQAVLDGYEGQVEYADPISGQVMLASYSPMSRQSGWGIVIEQRQDEALSPAARILSIAGWILLAACATAALLSWWISRGITRPILRLAQTTQQIARTGDLHQDVAVSRGDEIGQLASAFNQMIFNLRQAVVVLRESEEKYRTLVEMSPDGIFLEDTSGRILECNQAGAEIYGYSPKELLGLTIRELVPEDFARTLPEQIVEDSGGRYLERVSRRKDGSLFPSEISTRFSAIGGQTFLLAQVRDTSARVRLEQEAAKIRADFLFAVSHELKTPLLALSATQEMLEILPEEQRAERFYDYAVVWRRNLLRLRHIVENLVDSQRPPGMGMKLEKQPFSAMAVAAEVIKELEPIALAKRVTLTLEAEALPEVALDPHAWARLLENLLTNAIKFSPSGGEVRTRFTRLDEGFQMAVIDRGSGISPQAMPFLFEPFYRSPEAMQAGIQGTGLGLYVVKMIADAHGCVVEVESEEGKGTTVTVRLPGK